MSRATICMSPDTPIRFDASRQGPEQCFYEVVNVRVNGRLEDGFGILGETRDPLKTRWLMACERFLADNGRVALPKALAGEIAELIEDYGTEDCTDEEHAVRAEMIRALRGGA